MDLLQEVVLRVERERDHDVVSLALALPLLPEEPATQFTAGRTLGREGDAVNRVAGLWGLFKTEVIRQQGPWRSIETVEFAVLRWVHWFNERRLLEPLGYLPPAEFEQQYYQSAAPAEEAVLT